MTYYPDLSRYEYSDTERAMLNVGWRDRSHDFPIGQVSDAFVWLGTGEIHIEDANARVSARSLIVHYVMEHGYYPPEEFQAAVVRHTAGR